MLLAVPWLAATSPSNVAASTKLLETIQETIREQASLLVVLFLVSEVIAVLAGWVASKAVVKNKRNTTLLHSVKVQLFYLVSGLIAGAIAFSALRITESVNAAGFSTMIVVACLLFAVPMKIYEIDFVRSLGWVVLALIVNIFLNIGMSLVFGDALKGVTDKLAAMQGGNQPRRLTVDELEAEMEKKQRPAAGRPAGNAPAATPASAPPSAASDGRFDAQERIAGDKTRPQAERMAALTELYKLLEQERVALPAGDAAARSAFDQRRARYDTILQRMRAEPTPRPKK